MLKQESTAILLRCLCFMSDRGLQVNRVDSMRVLTMFFCTTSLFALDNNKFVISVLIKRNAVSQSVNLTSWSWVVNSRCSRTEGTSKCYKRVQHSKFSLKKKLLWRNDRLCRLKSGKFLKIMLHSSKVLYKDIIATFKAHNIKGIKMNTAS